LGANHRRSFTRARHLPSRLVELIEQLTITYAGFTAQQEQELADALARGDASVDLTYRLPPSVTDESRRPLPSATLPSGTVIAKS